jgi:hypothetical protein
VIDLDRASLDRFLPPAPLGSPDWGDVMSRAGAHQASRRRLVVLASALLVLAVGAASALAVRAFFIDKGFIGLPPEGATASAPRTGELVLSAWAAPSRSRTRMWVYADGRLIFQREKPRGGDLPTSANRASSGVLEQHLTTRGVALLRAEAFSSGLLRRDLALSLGGEPCGNAKAVRIGERLAKLRWHGSQCLGGMLGPRDTRPATPREARALRRLVERLTYPASWLPAGAWRDRRARAYVPARFELQYGPWPLTAKLSDILEVLPAPAADLFRATRATPFRGYVGFSGNLVPAKWHRFNVTTKQARALRISLVDAGLEVEKGIKPYALAYRVPGRDLNGAAVSITFLPMLPHGEAVGIGG